WYSLRSSADRTMRTGESYMTLPPRNRGAGLGHWLLREALSPAPKVVTRPGTRAACSGPIDAQVPVRKYGQPAGAKVRAGPGRKYVRPRAKARAAPGETARTPRARPRA